MLRNSQLQDVAGLQCSTPAYLKLYYTLKHGSHGSKLSKLQLPRSDRYSASYEVATLRVARRFCKGVNAP